MCWVLCVVCSAVCCFVCCVRVQSGTFVLWCYLRKTLHNIKFSGAKILVGADSERRVCSLDTAHCKSGRTSILDLDLYLL